MILAVVSVNGKFLSLYEDVYSANDMLAPKLRVDDKVMIKLHRFLLLFHHRSREFPGLIPDRIVEGK